MIALLFADDVRFFNNFLDVNIFSIFKVEFVVYSQLSEKRKWLHVPVIQRPIHKLREPISASLLPPRGNFYKIQPEFQN